MYFIYIIYEVNLQSMENYTISPKEVQRKLTSGTNSFILVDIRAENEYNDWNIKGSINLPVNPDIVAGNYTGIKNQLKTLPKDKLIITVCQRGINSQVASSILREMQYNSVSMENGMKGWNENFDIYELDFKDFTAVQFVRVGKGCLSYIVYSKKDKSAAVFEPSIFIDEYTEFAKTKGLNIKYVIDTHSHADHFSGAMALAKTLNLDYYINEIDVDKAFDFKSLRNVKNLELGGVDIKILNTPGHTDGSLSFLINNEALICGDLLLLESPGRPDLARTKEATIAGAEILFNTLQNVILKLDESVKILPSHFTKTGIRP